MVKKAFSAVLTVLALICSAFLPSFAAQSGKIDFNNPDFIRGMDISSVLSLEQSGVKFYDERDSESDLFKILAYHGVNYIPASASGTTPLTETARATAAVTATFSPRLKSADVLQNTE